MYNKVANYLKKKLFVYCNIKLILIMSPISNVKIIKYINELTSKVEKLSDIVTYQTKLIQELKTDNSNLINLINTEFKKK